MSEFLIGERCFLEEKEGNAYMPLLVLTGYARLKRKRG